MKEPRLSKAETRILEQYWKLGTASVREVLESLPEDERVAYTTVQTLGGNAAISAQIDAAVSSNPVPGPHVTLAR